MPRRQAMHISAETIYKTIYFRSRTALHHSMLKLLRRAHSLRHSKRHSRKGNRGTISIVNGRSIHERPKYIEKRGTVGHWEGDLVTGSKNTHIATLVCRRSRYTIILKVNGKDAHSVNEALKKRFHDLPRALKKSLTWDRGMELAKHQDFSLCTEVPVFFCDPQCPWQRGTNENTNALIRQYFPKKTCLAQHTQERLDEVAFELNNRPRKTLEFKTPQQIIEKALR